jgi:hypothetical protein
MPMDAFKKLFGNLLVFVYDWQRVEAYARILPRHQ